MSIVEHVSFQQSGESSGYMPRSGITGSSGNIIPSFYIFYIGHLLDIGVNIFSQSVGSLFVLLIVFFALQKLFSFIKNVF